MRVSNSSLSLSLSLLSVSLSDVKNYDLHNFAYGTNNFDTEVRNIFRRMLAMHNRKQRR